MIAVHLEPAEQARLEALAAERGETAEQAAGRLLAERLGQLADAANSGWTDLSDDEWADAATRLAAECLPPEDWGDIAPPAGPRGDGDGPR